MLLTFFLFHISSLPSFPSHGLLFFESFDSRADFPGWTVTQLPNYTGEWKVRTPPSPRCDIFERLLTLTTPRSYSAISSPLSPPVSPISDTFVIQYEVRFLATVTCTGAYIKLFSDPNFDPSVLSNETKHFMMFGPDLCADKNRLAFYFHHTNPRTKNSVEKTIAKPPKVPVDNLTHLYTLVIRRNGSLSFMIDKRLTQTLEFENAFEPPLIPPTEIPEPGAVKPEYWDDREFVPDDRIPVPVPDPRVVIPDSRYADPPAGWLENEPPFVDDPDVPKPESWDDELFGDWNPPQIENPNCANAPGCGPYYPPLIANPNHTRNYQHPQIKNPFYRGKWVPPKVPNPEFFYDPKPYLHWPNITGIGFELWSVDGHLGFNNVLLANNESAVMEWNRNFFMKRQAEQRGNRTRNISGPKPRTIKLRIPLGIVGVAFWQILDGWSDLYRSSQGATMALTVGVLLIPLFVIWGCSRRNEKSDEGEEEEEVEVEKEQ